MRTLALVGLSLALASGPALAQDSGFYLGAGVGEFGLEFDEIDDEDIQVDFDSDDTSLKLFGGWRFNPFFAFELAYIDFGAPDEDIEILGFPGTLETEVTGYAPYAVVTLPVGIFEVFAKVGYVFYDVEFTFDSDIGSVSVEESDEDLVYGAGVGLVLFDHLNARLEYEVFDVGEDGDANCIWLTGAWRF